MKLKKYNKVTLDNKITKGAKNMFTLKIDAFRGFETQKFEFKKYNIFIGENSGGKSSLLKFIMLLKQSMKNLYSSDSQLLLEGPLVDVGEFSDFVKNHDESKKITVTYTTSSNYDIYYLKVLNPSLDEKKFSKLYNEKSKSLCSFWKNPVDLTFLFDKNSIHDVFSWTIKFSCKPIGMMSLSLRKTGCETMNGWTGVIKYTGTDKKKYRLKITASIDGFMILVDGASLQKAIDDQSIDDELFFEKIAYMLIAQNEFAHILTNFDCLNPVEYHPERFIIKREMLKHNSVSSYQLAVTGLRNIFQVKQARKDFLNAISFMGLAENVKIEESSTSPVISLKTTIGGVESNVIDVGYGVSLQIPMIMHLIYVKYFKHISNIIFEQPEIHLHPALQAKFIEVLAKFGGNNSSFFIETHSEHMLRKLQVLVKKGFVEPDDVAVYYFKNKSGKFSVKSHKITKKGFVEPEFPKEFYDTDFNLTMELM